MERTKTYYTQKLSGKRGQAQGYKNQKEAVEAAYAKRQQRNIIAAETKQIAMQAEATPRERAVAKLAPKFEEAILKNYRKAEGRWAGGNNSVSVVAKESVSVYSNTYKEYSSNGKWSGLSLGIHVAPGLRHDLPVVVDGLVNLYSRIVEPGVYAADWIMQGRGLELRSESGYIAKHGKMTYHAKTIQAAKKGLEKKRKADILARYAKRIEGRDLLRQCKGIEITVEVAHEIGGYCFPGIENFRKQYDLNDDSYDLSHLILKTNYAPQVIRLARAIISSQEIKIA